MLLGNGDGTFKAVENYDPGGLLSWMAVADVNGDGKPDLLVANQDGGSNNEGSVGVLLNNGNGTFRSFQTYSSGGLQADFVTAADVNADGKPDLLVANVAVCNNCAGNVGVLLGNGDGTFQPAVSYSAGAPVSAVSVADLSGDGKLDLVLTNGGGAVTVLRGNGDGSFEPAVVYPVGGLYNHPPIMIDLNGDHKLDLAMAIGACNFLKGAGCVGVMLGNGDGTFQSAVDYHTLGVGTGALAAGDLNGDGITDFVTVSQCANRCADGGEISVLLGNGDGTFQPAILHGSGGYNTTWVGATDLRGNGRLDVVAVSPNAAPSNGSVAILINNASGLAATSIKLGSSLNPSPVGQAVTFTATVSSTTGKPSGGETITFTNGTNFLGTGRLKHGAASFTTPALPGGVSSITAIYNGDSTFSGSASAPLAQVVKAGAGDNPTVTAVFSSVNPSLEGKPVTFTATVSPQPGGSTPTGKITFLNGGAILLTKPLSQGSASYPTSFLPPGSNSIRAVYLGDSNYDVSTSAPVNQVVLAATTTTLTSTPNPSAYGESVLVTATIGSSIGAPPNGETVTFKHGTTVLGTGILSGGSTSFAISTLPVSTTGITAAYAGDASFAGSTSKPLSQVISKAATVTTLQSSANPAPHGTAVTFTATVTPAFSGSLSGAVTFKDGVTTLKTVTLSGGVAAFTISTLSTGTHHLTATYSGNASFIGSSGTLTQTVN